MGGIIDFRFFALVYLFLLPFHSHAVGQPPDPSPGSSPAPPDTTPLPELSEGPNSAPVHFNICNGDINIYNDCTFYGNPPGADEARRPARGGEGGYPSDGNAVTVTVTEYVTKTRTVYAKGPAPPTPQPINEQADGGAGNGRPDPVSEPSEPHVDRDSGPEPVPAPEVEANAGSDAGAEPVAEPDADAEVGTESIAGTDASSDTINPLDADEAYVAKKKTYNDADVFADEFSDSETKMAARFVHQYWSQARERVCRVCIAVIDKIGKEISEEEQDELSKAFGKDRRYFEYAKTKLDETYESLYQTEGEIPEINWGEECRKVVRNYFFERATANRKSILSAIRRAESDGDNEDALHHRKRLHVNDIYFDRIRTGQYDLNCKKEEQLDKMISMWKELNEKQTVFNFGGTEEERVNNLNVENEAIGEGEDDGDLDVNEEIEQNGQKFRRWKG